MMRMISACSRKVRNEKVRKQLEIQFYSNYFSKLIQKVYNVINIEKHFLSITSKMERRELETTAEGKELMEIQELSQDLQRLFKESEHLKRQNFLFESYFMRLEKEYKKEETTGKKKTRITQEKSLQGALTAQEKYEIAQQEAEALKETIQQGRIRSDAILETLRAILEETDMAIAEIRKDAYDFQREILMGGENNRTGNIEAERIQKFFEQKERQKRALIEKYRNKKQTLATQIVKTSHQITKKEEMGDELKFIDFHQLQIENRKYMIEIKQKSDKLIKTKLSSGKIGTELLQVKKRLNQMVSQISKYQKEITEKYKIIQQLNQAKEDLTFKQKNLNDKKRNLLTQAQQMKSPNNTTQIPDTMAYVLQKRKEEKLLYEKKNLQRKILIATPMFQKARKALGY